MAAPIPIRSIEWTDRLLRCNGKDPTASHPYAILANCLIALRHSPEWTDCLTYNEFTHRVYAVHPPWAPNDKKPREWGETEDSLAAEWFQRHAIRVSTAIASEACRCVAHEHAFNPVFEYLNGLTWDRWSRCDTWLTDYLGVPLSDASSAMGRAWLISAVARVFSPGCKADHCLILEGPQGRGKSTALKILAGTDYFSDYVSEDLGSKEASILCANVWIVEFAELQAILHRANKMETVKAFLSRTDDRYRPHYARNPVQLPRHCVFAATTNQDTYLFDGSGNRRFWPVKCGDIDLNGLDRDRDQLWAEAVSLFLDGHPWHLSEDLEIKTSREQEIRYDADPWQDLIADWISKRQHVSVSEVLKHAIGKVQENWTRADQLRVVQCLKSLSWERYKMAGTGLRRYRKQGSYSYKTRAE